MANHCFGCVTGRGTVESCVSVRLVRRNFQSWTPNVAFQAFIDTREDTVKTELKQTNLKRIECRDEREPAKT